MPNPIDRRSFLRSSGVAIALPALDAMVSRRQAVAAEGSGVDVPRRMVAINVGLGLHVPNLYPEMSGRDYKITPYLEPLRDLKNNFTVISGASHPEVDGGHHSEKSFLTAIPHPNSAGFRNSISIDLIAAEKIGIKTRYAYLCLSLAGRGLSWSRSGVEIPSATRPSGVFARMFLEGKADEKARTIQQLKDGQSIMDSVLAEAKSMNCRLGVRDRQKLDQFFTAVRSTETRLQKQESWEHRPKPQVDAKPPRDITDRTDIIGKARLMYDMMYLALQTDSTRLITFFKNQRCQKRLPQPFASRSRSGQNRRVGHHRAGTVFRAGGFRPSIARDLRRRVHFAGANNGSVWIEPRKRQQSQHV
jgi:hypothetical protein